MRTNEATSAPTTPGPSFRNDIVTGPGGCQILLEDPSGNVIELFRPAGTRALGPATRGVA